MIPALSAALGASAALWLRAELFGSDDDPGLVTSTATITKWAVIGGVAWFAFKAAKGRGLL